MLAITTEERKLPAPAKEIPRLGSFFVFKFITTNGKKPHIPPSTHPTEGGSRESSAHMYGQQNGLPKVDPVG